MDWETLISRHHSATPDTVRGRYAPSPSGPLHLGNLRTALVAWLQARLVGGAFILRIEDLDRPRVRPGCAEAMLRDLRWLGLDWDEGPDCDGPCAPYTQSERDKFYHCALDYLLRKNQLFHCYCSRKDLAQAASAPHEGDITVMYPGTCRAVANSDATDARSAALRFRAPAHDIAFHDQVYGPQQQQLAREVGDFVVRRSDHLVAYQLAVVVDDALMGITDVVRGADLLDSTPRQIALLRALDWPTTPRYWHVPLMRDANGARLAKRTAAASLATLQAEGATPAQVIGMLSVNIGLVSPGIALTPQELLRTLTADSLRASLQQATTT